MHMLISNLKSLTNKGLFHVMGSTVINKIIAFITNIFLVHILTKVEFGVFSSAFNIFLIVSLFTGFGMPSATLYFASEKEDERTRIGVYRYALLFGCGISIILSCIILLYGLYGNVGIEDSRQYVIMLTFLPIFNYFVDYYAVVLRTRKDNKRYALLLNINSFSYAVLAVLGSLTFGVTGTILSRYFAYMISGMAGYFFTRDYIDYKHYFDIDPSQKKDIVKYASYSGGVSALNNILYRIDITLISILIADAGLLASYKVAAVVPENMNFIPQSILIVFLPLFIEHQEDKQWLISHSKQLFKSMAIVCGTISILLVISSNLIIRILYGSQYLDGSIYFKVLAISFFFLGVFRSTSTNILQALGKVRFNLLVSIIACFFNILLDVVLINAYDALGAAIATLSVTIIASAISFPYLIKSIKSLEA